MRDPDPVDLPPTAAAPLVAPSGARPVSVRPPAALGDQNRYSDRAVLGVGGMGEVRLVRDERIGRDVAMKVMRTLAIDPERFLREARVQGQLEHPSIVPVYDLARSADGGLFFTMKRVRGVTLEEAAQTSTRRKLLSSFVSVCLAVDFAHSRGVVHRDLKPSNIMLGDFGEVYVLDWGIAKLLHDEEPASVERVEQGPAPRTMTAHGAVLGTIGYMAPEQLSGDPVDARSDVYALGAVLFELLTGEPLHEGETVNELAKATLMDASDRVHQRCRAHDVPPELEGICVRATAVEPADRFAGARALSDAIERYLDGDRDLARRRELAREHAARASRSVAAALEGDDQARREATAEAGRALALDPESEDASRTLMTLMTTPPRQTPTEVAAEIERGRFAAARTAGWAGLAGCLSIVAMIPFVLWMGIREWGSLAIGGGAILCSGLSLLASGKWPRQGRALLLAAFGCGTIFLLILARMFGPLLAAPTIALGLAVTGGFHPLAPRWSSVVFAAIGVALPVALDLAGLVAPAYSFEPGGMLVHPVLTALPRTPTLVYLLVSSISVIFATSAYMIAVRRALDEAQRTVLVQSWQLRHLVPRAARAERDT